MKQKIDLNYSAKKLGIKVIKLISTLPHNLSSKIIANQIIISSPAIGINYRTVCKEFIAKLGLIKEKIVEILYWFKILQLQGGRHSFTNIHQKKYLITKQILAITIASLKIAKKILDLVINNSGTCKLAFAI
ncbi:MAG: four helix bundle protein [Candidatus Goldbacteria bacterium]|nr:four helix bundle protein [Candidatus Goldiibacteriota bacterium]